MKYNERNWVLINADFRKSSFSENGDCVEVAKVEGVVMRDSKDPDGPVLLFSMSEWEAFSEGMLDGQFKHIR